MTSRVAVACVLLAGAGSGLLFAPVFGLWPLVPPIAVVLVACYAVAELCARFPSLGPWRPVLALVAGLLGLAEVELGDTMPAGLPTAGTVRALLGGVTESWQLTLQSTWPVRPDAELLLFVPLAVLLAAVLGIESLRWPAVAVLPALAVLGLSQAYVALSGTVATVVALGYAAVVAALFTTSRPGAVRPAWRGTAALLLVPTTLLGVLGAVVVTVADQGRQPAYSLYQNAPVPAARTRSVNPLDEVATRLERPDVPVFSYASADEVDRWRLVVLTEFNGVTWSKGGEYRRLGTELGSPPSVTVPTTAHSAQITVGPGSPDQPWVPSQSMPASVDGAAPLVSPGSGMLLLPGRSEPVSYGLRWWEPVIDPAGLAGAALDPATSGGGDLGVIPAGITELARAATGGLRPSFQTALALERFLSQNYRVATGADLPTGNGWPQLSEFLLVNKRGTSEQFAASYVAMAKLVGIQARLVVGFRAPEPGVDGRAVVRNGNVLAWPEVAVTGVGWVPLDPTGGAGDSAAAMAGLAEVTAKARAELPPAQELHDPPLPDSQPGAQSNAGLGGGVPVLPAAFVLLALIVLATVTIPMVRVVRTQRRKRRQGAPGVVAAWQEARDLLRVHGARVTRGMTARDLARVAEPAFDKSVVDGLGQLAGQLDTALWSGAGADGDTAGQAWRSVLVIRRGLAARPIGARVRALFDPRWFR
ncbi:transglutaminaseTgpA domain-containing protein [Amycolatopsis nigrescens]|uniref:transglutaminase family protein n=1 Tax=Amycolatopsis nigrescens TaxID=381445 RepID=UPI00037D24FB|nr:transglutaminase domain-containing protein [Amycolatopsis nigrescens]